LTPTVESCNRRTVADALANRAWFKYITGALTIPAIVQYLHLRAWVDGGVLLDPGASNKVI
jgi:hypothetical protein